MNIKRFLVVILAAGAASAAVSAGTDWKTELAAMLESPQNLVAAGRFLQDVRPSLDGEDRMTADALLAFLSWKTGDIASERRLITAFFESYGDAAPFFGFLSESARRDFLAYWTRWTRTYPLITGIHLLVPVDDRDSGPPGELEIGIEIVNETLYKLSSGGMARDGGLWKPGFRILKIPLPKPFAPPFFVEYVLELKTGDFEIRRVLRIEAEILSKTFLESVPSTAAVKRTAETTRAASSGELSLYFGDELILIVRKTAPRSAPLTFPLPGPSMEGQKPFLPPPKNDPMASGVSILDAIGAAAKAISDLTRKKPLPPSPPSYRKAEEQTVTFIRREGETSVYRVQASVRLHAEKATLLETRDRSLSGSPGIR